MSVENQLVVVGPGGTCSPGGTLLFVVFNDVFPLSIYFVRFSTFPLNDSYYEFVAVFFVRLSTFLGMLLLYFGTDLSLSINHFL